MSEVSSRVPYLTGSVHTFTPGYGYGARVPTVRNQQTLPASMPTHRHPPLTERGINMCKTATIDLAGAKSVKRHSDQIALQSSGDYGKFFYTKPNVRDGILSRPHTSATNSRSNSMSLQVTNTETLNASKKGQITGSRCLVASDYNTVTKYRKKDPVQDAFSRSSKYDVLAAKSPNRGHDQVHWCVVGNQMAAEQSRGWELNLRPYKRPASTA